MSTPNSIRNVSWAVVRAGTERRHAYRKAVDIHLNGSKIGDITPAGARPTGPGENVIDGTRFEIAITVFKCVQFSVSKK